LELITSKLLGVPHGFSTRAGGVSVGPWTSLNAGGSVGDSPSAVAQNLERLAVAAKVERARLFGVSQVHGNRVVEAPVDPTVEADAIWSGRAGDAVAVKTADCVPLLFVDPKGKRVAAVHAGWKGTLAEISARAIEALGRAGSKREDLQVAIGPAIRRCCYEVSDELAARFATHFGKEVAHRREERWWLDLGFAVRRTLTDSGIPVGQIDDLGLCTSCDARFFSHRRDRGVTGRHLSFVTCHF
jgi:YfiH family protein